MSPPPTNIVVIGAGVTGLTTALHLLTTIPNITLTLLASHFPAPSETLTTATHINYTSPWGGAHHRWVPPSPTTPKSSYLWREHAWSVTTHTRMLALAAAAPHAGITPLPGIEYLEPQAAERGGYTSLTTSRAAELQIPGFEVLPEGELPEGVAWGCKYPTYCVNPMVYCAYLLRRCVQLGARVVRKEVRGWREVFALSLAGGKPGVVVNASGDGFDADPKVGVTRGQTVLVANEMGVTVTRQNDDGSWTFCVPRGFEGGTVIGGTKEVGGWGDEADPGVREELLRRFEGTWKGVGPGGWRVLGDIVGRRPTREGGPRVEAEGVDGEGLVVHAYGVGGRGYEISWGVAEEVGEGVKAFLEGGGKAKL
ncbi:putative D-amino-acid oxidase [Podospora conica]|nr:putative D-amino-acid oxidase [Schizothecium conicum]